MKTFFKIFILIFYLLLCSCGNIPPEPGILPRDNEATNVGNSIKTLDYPFADDFIYHEWQGENVILKHIPFNLKMYDYGIGGFGSLFLIKYNVNEKHWIKKLVTSKYFDIYVDITEGQKAFYKATNMTDVAYDKLIKELEKYYNHIKSVYGEPSNIDGNGKIEIVFHESHEMPKKANGYFCDGNIIKKARYTASMDVLYINSDSFMTYDAQNSKEFTNKCFETIFHELQHDIFTENLISRGFAPDWYYPSRKWINEALSISTYQVIHSGSDSGRSPYLSYFNSINNGLYFFTWDNSQNEVIAEYYETSGNFMYWLYLHGGGDKIIRDVIFLNPYKIIDMENIMEAAKQNIPALRGKSDADIIKTWYIANFLNEPNSINGYKMKNPNIRVGQANDSSGKVVLKPYCAVYTTTDMYSQNLSLTGRGIHLEKLKNSKGEEWLLILNGSSYDSIEVRINPNAIKHSVIHFLSEENLIYDNVFMYEEE